MVSRIRAGYQLNRSLCIRAENSHLELCVSTLIWTSVFILFYENLRHLMKDY